MKLLLITVLSCALVFAAKPKPHDTLIGFDDTVPVILLGGEWKTSIIFNNTNTQTVQFPLSFFNAGGPWNLPVSGVGNTSAVTVTLPPMGTVKIEFNYSSQQTTAGFATVNIPCDDPPATCGGVGVYAMLRNHNSARKQDFEVAYQLGVSINADQQQFPFDQSNFSQVVVNLTNTCYQDFCGTSTVALEIFDQNGARFFQDSEDLQPGEVKILNIAQLSQDTWNKVGMIRLSGVAEIVVTGHRINDTGSFTPLAAYEY